MAPKAAAPKAAPKPAAAATPAAPKVSAGEQLKLARQHQQSGKYDEALAAIEAGLAVAPKDDSLLRLKAEVLLAMNDEPGALEAYKALHKVVPEGSIKTAAAKAIANLTNKLTTFVEVTVTNGPARVRFGAIRKPVTCEAEPSCTKALAPGDHKVSVERPGFERWTGKVTAVSGKTAQLSVTLTESPSLLTVRVAQAGATVTVDGTAYTEPITEPMKVQPGKHEVVVSLDRHDTARLAAVAGLGKPIELDVTLARIVPVRIAAPGAKLQPSATLLLDGKPVALQDGSLRVQPGAHDLEVEAPGFQKLALKIPAEPGPEYQVSIALQPVVVARPPRFTLRRKLALVAGGIGLAALGTGAALGVQTRGLEDQTLALCASPATPCDGALEANDLNERARARASQANIAFGVAGGAVIAAAVLWFTGAPESRSRVAVTPHLGSQLGATAGLDLSVRF